MANIKPGILETKLFRYLCRQADYKRCFISKQPDYIVISIDFQKPITELIKWFANKNNLKFQDCLDIANTWLRRYKDKILTYRNASEYFPNIDKTIYYKEYFFCIVVSKTHNMEYYKRIPRRVIMKIAKQKNLNDFEFNPIIKEGKLQAQEKKFFRYICYNAVIDKCACIQHNDDDGCTVKLVTRNIHDIANEYLNNSKCNISKNVMRKIIHKWEGGSICSRIVSDYDSNFSLFLFLYTDTGLKHKLFNAIPERVLREMKNRS